MTKTRGAGDLTVPFAKVIKQKLDEARRETRKLAAALGYVGPNAFAGINRESGHWDGLLGDCYSDLNNEDWRELPASMGERLICVAALNYLEALLRPSDEAADGILGWAATVDQLLALVRREAPKACSWEQARHLESLKREQEKKKNIEKTIAQLEKHIKSTSTGSRRRLTSATA